jgi:hypothetical protein
VSVWRRIRTINGSIAAKDGPIRRHQLSTKTVVYSVSDYDREMAKLSRAFKRSA